MGMTTAQYIVLLGEDALESAAVDLIDGRFNYLRDRHPDLSGNGIASLVNSLTLERAESDNAALTASLNSLRLASTANAALIVSAISATI